MNDILRRELIGAGADVVGFADLTGFLDADIAHLRRAVSIGLSRNLNEKTVQTLTSLQKKAAGILKGKGSRVLCIPPDSDRRTETFISKLYPLLTHKVAATSAGIGWIGRNGLLISPVHGPRLSLATVLTDAPLNVGTPVRVSGCGDCRMCIELCPAGAITGKDWSRREPFVELVRRADCSSYKKKSRSLGGKPNCGLCITICPYGRKNAKKSVIPVGISGP